MGASPYFIVLEGIDGSGTTSQTAALSRILDARGHRVLQTREPTDGVIGRLIRTKLAVSADPLDRAALALLFAADRLDHLEREIEPALARGETVICDRYLLSSWAYQSLDCPLEWVRAINSRARRPDLTLFVDVDPGEAMRRVHGRQAAGESTPEFFEVPQLQQRLADTYRRLAGEDETIVRIDGNLDLDAVTRALTDACVAAGL
jgi:dTMP kinase